MQKRAGLDPPALMGVREDQDGRRGARGTPSSSRRLASKASFCSEKPRSLDESLLMTFGHHFSLRTQTTSHFFFGHAFDPLQKGSGLFGQTGPYLVFDHVTRKLRDGGGFEQEDRRQVHLKHLTQPGNYLCGDYGSTAQLKEIVVDTNLLDPQTARPDRR